VSGGASGDDSLFATRWVHVFEEDGAAGHVYRPEDSDIPLSRRPRERFELDKRGSGRLFTGGTDDRFVEQPATWKHEGNAVVIRADDGSAQLRIAERSPSRLLVQSSRPAPAA
jgi:hypothetical protein